MSKHAQEKKINIPLLIFRIISIIIIIISSKSIYNWYIENKSNKELLDTALSNVALETFVVDTTEHTILNVDFEQLLATNNETIGWIYVPNTRINYPIVLTDNNSFYLDHTLNKSYNSAGWIFADYRCNNDFSSKNTTIYGHNRRDGSMFATLKDTIKPEWYTTNKYITIATPEGNRIYEVFSTYQIKSELYYSTPDFSSDEEYIEFLTTIKNRSVYNFEVELNALDSIVTLSTCANNNTYRVVLHAKLLTILPNT